MLTIKVSFSEDTYMQQKHCVMKVRCQCDTNENTSKLSFLCQTAQWTSGPRECRMIKVSIYLQESEDKHYRLKSFTLAHANYNKTKKNTDGKILYKHDTFLKYLLVRIFCWWTLCYNYTSVIELYGIWFEMPYRED